MKQFRNLNLYKLLFLVIALVSFCSCSNDDAVTEQEEKEGLSLKLSANFDADPRKNMMNIQTGDSLFFDISLKDAHYSSRAKYVFSLNSRSSDTHQKLNYDYKAYLISKTSYEAAVANKQAREEINLDSLNLLDGDSAKLTALGKYMLIIIPEIPGLYQHHYAFKKEKDNSAALEKTYDNNFNAVKLTAWFEDEKTRHRTALRKAKYRNDFYIKVDCGERRFDNYLKKGSNEYVKCSVEYDGKSYEMDEESSIENGWSFYQSDSKKKHAPTVSNFIITRIKIEAQTKNEAGLKGTPIFIEYWNVPLTKRD